MQINQLEAFIAVAETGSLAKGSEKIYATPSALSQRIKLFESRLGLTVFVRTNKGMRLSENGQKIYYQAKKIIEKIRELNLNESLTSKNRKITIGLSSALDRDFTIKLISSEVFKNYVINLRLVSDDNTIQFLKEDILDLVFTFGELEKNIEITTEYLGHIKFNLVSLKEKNQNNIKGNRKIVIPFITSLIDSHIEPILENNYKGITEYLCTDFYETAIYHVLNNDYMAVMDSDSATNYLNNDERLTLDKKDILIPIFLAYKTSKFIKKEIFSAINSSEIFKYKLINMK